MNDPVGQDLTPLAMPDCVVLCDVPQSVHCCNTAIPVWAVVKLEGTTSAVSRSGFGILLPTAKPSAQLVTSVGPFVVTGTRTTTEANRLKYEAVYFSHGDQPFLMLYHSVCCLLLSPS